MCVGVCVCVGGVRGGEGGVAAGGCGGERRRRQQGRGVCRRPTLDVTPPPLSHTHALKPPTHTKKNQKVYIIWSILFIVFLILIVVTAFVTVALTYFQLAVEDHRWWWRSFFCGGRCVGGGLFVRARACVCVCVADDALVGLSLFLKSRAALSCNSARHLKPAHPRTHATHTQQPQPQHTARRSLSLATASTTTSRAAA